MATNMMFNSGFNQVGASNEGNVKASRQIADIMSQPTKNYAGDIVNTSVAAYSNYSNAYDSAVKTADANTAKGDYLSIVTSQGYLDADAVGKTTMLEEMNNTLGDRSDAYANSYMGYSAGEYAKQYKARGVIEDNAKYNAAGPASMAWSQAPSTTEDPSQDYSDTEAPIEYLTNAQAGNGPKDFVDQYVKANPRLDKVVVSRALMSDAYQEMVVAVDTAPATEEGLAAALADVEDIKAPYNTPMFLTTKQKQGQEYITGLERQLQASVKAKQKEIKEGHYDVLAAVDDGGNRTPPSAVDPHIDATSSNSFTAAKAKREYREKYVERTNADTYNENYPAGERPGYLPDNSTLKEERQIVVTEALFNEFNKGNMGRFVSIAQNEGGMTKQAGDQFLTMFNSATSAEEIQVLMSKFDSIDAQPQGAGVLRQMLTDDEYTRVKEVGYAIQARPELTPSQARDWIDGNKAKLNTLGLAPDKQRKLFEYAVKLGPQYDAYMSHMQQVMKGNPDIGESEMKKAALHFSNMNQEDSTGMKTNVAMGSNPSDDPKVMNKKDVDTKINTSLGDGVTNKTFLSNGLIIGKDEYGGTMTIVNTNDVVDGEGNVTTKGIVTQSNDETTEKLILAKEIQNFQRKGGMGPAIGFWESAKSATSNFVRDSIDNFTKIPAGLAESGGTLIDKFGDHLVSSMTEDQQKWWDTLTADDSSNLVLEVLDEEINKLDTTKGLDGVQNVVLSEADTYAFENAKFTNVQKARVVREIKDTVLKEKLLKSVSKHEGGYSSDKDDTGNYYKGEFVGTNFGVSAPVLAEYLGRTPTVSDMKKLTQEQADTIFLDKYYFKNSLDKLPKNLQEIVLNATINSGSNGIKVMQGLLGVEQDGIVGEETTTAMANSDFTKKEYKDALLKKYRTFKTWSKHGKGWTKRFEELSK